MKMVEIKVRSTTAELEKLVVRKERIEKALAKAIEKVNKLECNWTQPEFRAWYNSKINGGAGFSKADDARYDAWFKKSLLEDDYAEIEEKIEKATARFEEAQEAVETYRENLKVEMEAKAYEDLMKKEFAEEQKEWAKDGINLEARYYGTTPNGNRFFIDRNRTFSKRGIHCYTLRINGETIFTSGEFWRAYSIVKAN